MWRTPPQRSVSNVDSGAFAADHYRTVFHTALSARDAISAADGELWSWIRAQDVHVEDEDTGRIQPAPGTVLRHGTHSGPDGTQTRIWRLREVRPAGHQLTSLVVHAPGLPDPPAHTWFWLDVEFRPAGPGTGDTATPHTAVPELAQRLLDTVEAHDGLATLDSRPALIGPDEVDDLINVLCDPDRRLATVVASAAGRDTFDARRAVLDRLTRQLPGLASMYILDPVATERFNHEIGDTHWVGPGALRTYLPDVDPASADDATRHRVLPPSRIDQTVDAERLAALLGTLPRTLAFSTALPDPLAHIDRSGLIAPPRPEAAPPADDGEPAALRAENTALRNDLQAALDLVDDADLRERDAAGYISQLQDNVLDAALELELAKDDNARLGHRLHYLQRRLEESGDVDQVRAVYRQAPPVLPKSFEELLDRFDELSPVEFTGYRDHVLTLDEKALHPTWPQSTWEALTALQAYAQAKLTGSFAGNFRTWCEQTPPGRPAISAQKVANGESGTVRGVKSMRRERQFPVPLDVASDGVLFMGAHIRVALGRSVSPRLYFHDGTARTRKIYVGYIGTHLTNTKS